MLVAAFPFDDPPFTSSGIALADGTIRPPLFSPYFAYRLFLAIERRLAFCLSPPALRRIPIQHLHSLHLLHTTRQLHYLDSAFSQTLSLATFARKYIQLHCITKQSNIAHINVLRSIIHSFTSILLRSERRVSFFNRCAGVTRKEFLDELVKQPTRESADSKNSGWTILRPLVSSCLPVYHFRVPPFDTHTFNTLVIPVSNAPFCISAQRKLYYMFPYFQLEKSYV